MTVFKFKLWIDSVELLFPGVEINFKTLFQIETNKV